MNLQEQKTKLKKELKEINEKIALEKTNVGEIVFFDIPEKKIQISKLTYTNKTYQECKRLLKKGESIATYELLQWLRNNDKYRNLLGLENFWTFVTNPDKISDKNNYVAGLNANSDRAVLNCGRFPANTNPSLGVFVVRKKDRGKWNNLCEKFEPQEVKHE